MKKEFEDRLRKMLSLGDDDPGRFLRDCGIREVPARTVLLSEGEKAEWLFLVLEGCLRTYFVKETGEEITSQFFIEGQMVSSFESAMTGNPSRLYIATIEDSVVCRIRMQALERHLKHNESLRAHFESYLVARLQFYMNQHAAFILDSPEKRYVNLVRERPDLVSRIPRQYIASYLGVTPVSLSRIRSRLQKKINKG